VGRQAVAFFSLLYICIYKSQKKKHTHSTQKRIGVDIYKKNYKTEKKKKQISENDRRRTTKTLCTGTLKEFILKNTGPRKREEISRNVSIRK
jgi:hypothetical protein